MSEKKYNEQVSRYLKTAQAYGLRTWFHDYARPEMEREFKRQQEAKKQKQKRIPGF